MNINNTLTFHLVLLPLLSAVEYDVGSLVGHMRLPHDLSGSAHTISLQVTKTSHKLYTIMIFLLW